ncbi:hypothetical protein [Caminibacter sp.]
MTILTVKIENENLAKQLLEYLKKFKLEIEVERLENSEKKELFEILNNDKFSSIDEFKKKFNL